MDLIFIVALLITSVIAVAYIVERGLALRWEKVIPPAVESAVEHYDSGGDVLKLRAACRHYPSTLSRLLLFACEHLDWPKNENVDVLETRARHEVAKLERGLVVLEIIVGIAPLLGLVGTIYGLILLFGGMEQASATESARFAQGISLALRATLMGLCIAIPALVAWSYYTKKVETLAVEMATLCDEFLRKYYRSLEPPALRALAPAPAASAPPEARPQTITPMPAPETPLAPASDTVDPATLADRINSTARATRAARVPRKTS